MFTNWSILEKKKKKTKGKKSISDGQSHMSKIGGNCQGVQT